MTDRRLHIWPRGADVSAVKAIVQGLDLGYVVKPFWYTADSEGVERVLVLGDGFDHGTRVNYIHPLKPELLQESVEWALGLREESRGARLVQTTWDRIFGGHVEIGPWEDIHMEPRVWSD